MTGKRIAQQYHSAFEGIYGGGHRSIDHFADVSKMVFMHLSPNHIEEMLDMVVSHLHQNHFGNVTEMVVRDSGKAN